MVAGIKTNGLKKYEWMGFDQTGLVTLPNLSVGHLQFHIVRLGLRNQASSPQLPLTAGGFVFQQVVVKGATAHDFSRAGDAKTFCGGATGFNFWHDVLKLHGLL